MYDVMCMRRNTGNLFRGFPYDWASPDCLLTSQVDPELGVNHSFSSLWGRSIIDAHWVRQAEAIQRELYITGLNRSWVFRNGADSRIAGAGWCYVDRFYDVIGAATLLLDGVSRRAYHAYYRPTLFFPTELKQPTTPPKKKKIKRAAGGCHRHRSTIQRLIYENVNRSAGQGYY